MGTDRQQQLLPAEKKEQEKREEPKKKIKTKNKKQKFRPPLHAWTHARRAFSLLCCSSLRFVWWGEVLEIACSMHVCLFVCLFCWPCISIAFELCRRLIENLSRQNRRARLLTRSLASFNAGNFPIKQRRENCKKPAAASCGASYTS